MREDRTETACCLQSRTVRTEMPLRVIARLDVKPPFVVKPVYFEGLRKIGTVAELAARYYEQGADEICCLDVMASLCGHKAAASHLGAIVQNAALPVAAGGGVRSEADCLALLESGADKIIINTFALFEDARLIDRAAARLGSQAVVVSIEAKRQQGWWECYGDSGKNGSGKDAFDWCREAQSRGAGQLLVSSVDRDGAGLGFDTALIGEIVSRVSIPVVAASGAGSYEHVREVVRDAGPQAVAVASLLHAGRETVRSLKQHLRNDGVEVVI